MRTPKLEATHLACDVPEGGGVGVGETEGRHSCGSSRLVARTGQLDCGIGERALSELALPNALSHLDKKQARRVCARHESNE
jgi:hypothetical protein